MGKKRFFVSHSKSSAMVVSLAIHAVLILVAISVVAVKVIIREEPEFVVKKVKRPKMPLKKIKVPVDVKKKKPKPRLRKRIVSTKKTFTDIKMPEITGVAGGLGNMGGDGLGSLGFEIEMDLFGGNKSMGNELEGTFFDLKQTEDGKPTGMTINKYFAAVHSFSRGWKVSRLDDYFQAPKKKYASFFMIPTINSTGATKAFGVEDSVKADFWTAYYTGHIAAPATGHYRFSGQGDDILLVRVNKRLVLDAGWEPYKPKINTGWDSDDENNRKYPLGGQNMYIGDWFQLTKGEPVKMEVLIGDVGGLCASQLLIEKKGETYKQAPYRTTVKEDGKDVVKTGTRPVLPVFKTKEIPKELHEKVKLNTNQATLEGPSFGAVVE